MKRFIFLCLLSAPVFAGSLTPYVSLGAYHRMCQNSYTDSMLCDDPKIGSDTPGTIDLGFRLRGCGWWCLGADQTDIGIHHQSYVDRGSLIIHDFGGPETYLNAIGVRFTWEIESAQIAW